MKIIFMTDIHDALVEMKEVFQQTSPDLYLLCGDIIYKAFFSSDRIIDFCTVQDELMAQARKYGYESLPYDFATMVLRYPEKFNYDLTVRAGYYRVLFSKAAKTMKEKYLLIEQLVRKYAQSTCYFLPGNYDIDLQYTALIDMDLHRKSIEIDDIKFSGYGGAPISTPGIPEKLAVKFHEYTKKGMNFCEPEDYFISESPDVLVIHNPAYGYFDRVRGIGSVGSQGIRRYVDDYPPLLVLSGHVHEDMGIIKKNGTVFLNTANFGTVESIHGYEIGGYFAEIDMQGKQVVSVFLKRIMDGVIEDLIHIDTSGPKLKIIYANENSAVSPDYFVRN